MQKKIIPICGMSIGLAFSIGLIAYVLLAGHVVAETKALPEGPPAKVTKQSDKYLFQIYVTPPEKSETYTPGEISIMLRRDSPDYLYVPLKHKLLKDGRLHVQIAITEKAESKYTIVILDEQKDGTDLLLYSNPLVKIEAENP